MPIGDAKHQLIYKELVNILGDDYVDDDPAIMEAFSRESQLSIAKSKNRCEFIVLPGSCDDVQLIYKLANRCHFPVSVTSTGLSLASCNAINGYPYWCLVDPKRMDHLSIDSKNMFAVVEPYVSIAQLQAEAMKVGLFIGSTGTGTQTSALATNIYTNSLWTGWRTGKGRGLLGIEMVLPNGDIFRTGSLALFQNNYMWGEGPGIDARGLIRGGSGHKGAMGMVTRAAIKLFPWPGPPVWPTDGVQPEKVSILPHETFKTIIFSHSTLEDCVECIREIGEAEIGGVVMQCHPYEVVGLVTRSREEFWSKWQEDFWQEMIHNRHMTFVTLWGYAGIRQIDYEEKVLKDIIEDTKGQLIPEEEAVSVRDEITASAVRDTHRMRYARMGKAVSIGSSSDSLYDALRSLSFGMAALQKFSPPLGDGKLFDRGQRQHKMTLADFGRIATVGTGPFSEKSEEFETFVKTRVNRYIKDLRKGRELFVPGDADDASLTGARFANIHIYIASIKRALDPENIANPVRLINMRNMLNNHEGENEGENAVLAEE
jgi:hypothetical protein